MRSPRNCTPFDSRGRDGLRLRSGVYFYRVTTPAGTMTQKMVLLR